jgi:hypothetical protein
VIIAVDFDGTIVYQDSRDYDDVTTPLRFMPGAREALTALKLAGHTIIIYSARANRSLCCDPEFNPLIRSGRRPTPSPERAAANRTLNTARYMQMIHFVNENLQGVVDAIDDGGQGKVSADLYIDDKALRFGDGEHAANWGDIAFMYGEADGI